MGFSANSLGRLSLEIGYSVDKSGLNQIQNSLSDLMNKSKMLGANMDTGMKQAAASAKQLSGILASATDPKTGALNVGQLANSFKFAGTNLADMRKGLSQAGVEGQQAFAILNKQILNTQTTLTKTEGIAAQLGKTFMNTFMYSFSYRIVGSFITGVSNAISYVKDLDKALTNIRIVTKESRSEMEKFAEKANTAAKNLGVSTKAYTEASLIFTQQGLKGKERDVRTETTMKVANVTGDDAAQVSQNLTAVWNGYKISSEQAEAAIDKLANVAAHSASNLAELSTGMSKVASAANSMGVSEDQLVSQLATIESVTRQAPESIGTALKTIYARMGDLQVKGTDEFGTSLGEVSGKLQQMGVDILDQEGNMKDMGLVMEEVAGKWDTWTKAQQQAAAVAMAGKRQYNNLISLFSNWDKYQENMQYSQNSEGQIEAQQQIYLDSIEGVKGKMQASWEEVYSNLFDADTMKGVYEMITGIADAIGNLGDALPVAAFVMIGNILKDQIVTGMTKWTMGMTKAQQQANMLKLQEDAIKEAEETAVYIGKQRVFTNQEILNATQSNGMELRVQQGESVKLSRENMSLAQTSKMRLSVQEGLTEQMQEQFHAQQQVAAAEEGKISNAIMEYGERAKILGLNKEQMTLSADSAVAAEQMAQAYEISVPVLDEILTLSSQIYTESGGNRAQALGQVKQLLREEVIELDGEKVSLENIIQNDEQRLAIEKEIGRIMNQSAQNTENSAQRIENMKNKVQELKMSFDGAAGSVRTMSTKLTNANSGIDNMTQQAQKAKVLSTAYTGLTNSIFGVSMAGMSLNALWNTINDPDTSGIEKFTSVLMNLGMVIMSLSQFGKGLKSLFSVIDTTATIAGINTGALIPIYQQYNNEISLRTAKELSLIMIQEKGNEVSLNALKAKMLEAEGLRHLNNEKKEEIVDSFLASEGIKYENKQRQLAIGTMVEEIAVRIKNIALKIKELALAHPYIAAIVGIVAVIGTLILAYANSTTKQQEHIKALQEGQKETYQASETLKEMTDKYEDLKSSLSELKDEYAVLETLTQGTQEWDDQVIKLNGHVAELLTQYPQLAEGLYTDENGVFRFKEGATSKVASAMSYGIEQQQKTLLEQQGRDKSNEKIVLADNMSDILESDPNVKIGAEYSEEMMNAINNTAVKTVSDLKNTLKQQGVPVNKTQAASLFSLLQEARAKDTQKIALLKQSANIAKKNSDINFKGKGETEEEKKENAKAKNDAYDNFYTQAKMFSDLYMQQNDLGGNNYRSADFNREDEWLGLRVISPDIGDNQSGWRGIDDVLLKGDKRNITNKWLAQDLQKMVPEYLKPYITKDLIKQEFQNNTQNLDILHWASLDSGIARSNLKYVDDVGVVQVGKEDEAITGYGFKDGNNSAYNKMEDKIIDTIITSSLEEFVESGHHLSDLDTAGAKLASFYNEDKKTVKDYNNIDVSTFKNGEWLATYNGELNKDGTTTGEDKVAKQIDEYNKAWNKHQQDKNKDSEEWKKEEERLKTWNNEIEILKTEYYTIGQAVGQKVQKTFNEWNDSTQTAYQTGNITVAEGNEMNRMVEQVRSKGQVKDKTKTSIEKAYNKLAEAGGKGITEFSQALKSIDWSKPLDVDSIKSAFEAYGLDVKQLGLDWKKIAEEAKNITAQTDDLAGNLEKYNQKGMTYLSIVKGLKEGDTISKEQYESIISDSSVPEDVKQSFSADGRKNRYIYLGTDASGLPDPSKAGIKKAMMGEDSENAIQAANRITNQFGDKSKIKLAGDDTDYDDLKYKEDKKRGSTYHNDVKTAAVDLVTNAFSKDKDAYKTLETVGGGDYKDMLELMRDKSGQGLFKWKDGQIVGWAKEMQEEYGTKYKEWLKSTREMQTSLDQGSFDPTKTGTLSTALQTDAAGVTDMYSKINTYATDAKYSVEQEKQKHTEALSALQAQAAASAEALGGTTLEEANFTAALDRANPKIKEQSDLLLETAGSATYNLMKGVEKLSGLFTDTYKDVQKGTTQYYQMLNDVATTANDAFGTNLIDEGFVDKNLGLFKKMAKGSKSAIKEIQLEILKTNKTTLGIKFTGLKQTQSEFWNLVQSLQNANVSIDTNLNTVEFFRQLAAAIAQMKDMTVGQMNEIFSNMSISLEWDAGVSDDTKTKDLNITDKNGNYNKGKNNKLLGGFKVLDKNANYSGAAAAGNKNSGSSGKGSGSGSAPQKQFEEVEENDIDKLHDLKQALEDLTHTLDQYKKQQDRAFGQGYIDNLNKQNEYIKEQNKNLKAQARILAKELAQDQFDMKKLYGFRFDKDGRIKNYSKVINKAYNKYKNLADEYNSMSAKKQDSKSGKNLKADLDEAKEYWQKRKDLVSKYDDKYNDRQGKLNQLIDNYNEISDNNLKKLHAMSEAVEKTNEIQKVYLDYQKDILHSSKDRVFAAQYNVKSFKLNRKQLVEDKKELKKLNKELKEFKKKGISKKNYLNTKGVVDATLNSAKKNLENIKNLQQNLLDTITALSERWKDYAEDVDRVMKKYDALSNSLKNYEEITKLLYGEDEYSTFTNINREEYVLQRSKLNSNITKRSGAESRLRTARKEYNDSKNAKNKSSEAIQKLKDEVKAAEDELNSINQDIEAGFKDTASALVSIYTNTINDIFKKASDNLTSGYGWDTISDSLKRDKQYSDEWLDDAQKIGNIAQLTATFEQEIAKAIDYSASSQQKLLQCKQEELAALEKIDKLTQADIDRVRAKLSLTLKQIALEEARENKSKLRLKRDSQGNYSYQYSADQEAIAKAKEEYEAARLKLSEDSQKELFSLMSSRQQIEQEMVEKTKSLYEELGKAQKANNKSEEKRIRQEINDVIADGTKRLQHNESAIDRWTGYVYEDNLGYFNEKNGTNYSSIEEAQKYDKNKVYDFFWGEEGLIPSSTTGFMSMNHSTDQFIKQFNKAFKDGDNAVEELADGIKELGQIGDQSMKTIITGSGNTKGLVGATQQTKAFEKQVNKLTTAFKKENTAIGNSITSLINAFSTVNTKDFKEMLKKTSELANNFEKVKTNMQDFIKLVLENAGNIGKALSKIKTPSVNALTDKKNRKGKTKATKYNNSHSGSSSSGGGSDSGSGGGYESSGDREYNGGSGDDTVKYYKKTFKDKNNKKHTYYLGSDNQYYTKDKKHSFGALKELKDYVLPYKTKRKILGKNKQVSGSIQITKKANSNKYKVSTKTKNKKTHRVNTKTRTYSSKEAAKKAVKTAKKELKKYKKLKKAKLHIKKSTEIASDGTKVKVKYYSKKDGWKYYDPYSKKWYGTKKGNVYKSAQSAANHGARAIKRGDHMSNAQKYKIRIPDVGYVNGKAVRIYRNLKGEYFDSKNGHSWLNARSAAMHSKKGKQIIKKAKRHNNSLDWSYDKYQPVYVNKKSRNKTFQAYVLYKGKIKKAKYTKIKGSSINGSPFVDWKKGYVAFSNVAWSTASMLGQPQTYYFKKKSIEKNFHGFDTGGYTGSWGNKNGKLALLHEKEIVLNKKDTANFLEAVKLTRRFAQDLSQYKTGLINQISSISNNSRLINNSNSQTKLNQQHINIKASFPNATNSSEIEKAFQQLSAKATQYAWSNKIK